MKIFNLPIKLSIVFIMVFACSQSVADNSPLTETLALMKESHNLQIDHVSDQKARLYWQVEDARKVDAKTLEVLQRLRQFLQSKDTPWYLYVAVFNKKTESVSAQQALASSRYKAKNIEPFLKQGQFALHDIQVIGLGSAVNEPRILVNIGQGTAPLLMRLWVEKAQ